MIISTIPDMFGEHYYFIKEVFPQLKKICNSHDIDLEYIDLFFSMSEEEFKTCRSIQKYFNSIDSDRTFYICFRGQKLGCVPTPADIDNGNAQSLPPVRHSFFYFRNDDYLNELSDSQKEIYTCGHCDDEFVQDLKLAMAKDLVFHDKYEFDKLKDNVSNINIRRYDGVWDKNLALNDVLDKYIEEYVEINDMSIEDLPDYYDKFPILTSKGCFNDFNSEGNPLKNIIIEDFVNELKLEFPQKFK